MHRAARPASGQEAPGLVDVDDAAGAHRPRRKRITEPSRAVSPEAEHVGQDRAGRRGVLEQQRHAVKAADRVLRRHVAVAPAGLALGAGDADQREAHAVGIGERQHGFAEALLRRLMGDALLDEAMGPVAERTRPARGTRSAGSGRRRRGRAPHASQGKKVRIVPGLPASSP